MEIKTRLHPRNRNRERYDLGALLKTNADLSNFIKPNKHGIESIDFSNPKAVKTLNKALLKHYYGIKNWNFPDENLCPPIPGRADYIHYMADLLSESNFGRTPKGNNILCLDIGVGASCIYPIIGVIEYNWNFIGSDIDQNSIAIANNVVNANPQLKNKVECKLQVNSKDFFYGIIRHENKIDLSICNPPFHSSREEALEGTKRKIRNLTGRNEGSPLHNFAGNYNELVYEGGEYRFIHNMIKESLKFSKNCLWFSTLVSKQSNLKGIYKALDSIKANTVKTIPMGTGNKSSRIVAWTFFSKKGREEWRETRWKEVI